MLPPRAHAVVVDDSSKHAQAPTFTNRRLGQGIRRPRVKALERYARVLAADEALQDGVPGAIPAGAAPSVPSWIQTGWKQVAQGDNAKENILSAYL